MKILLTFNPVGLSRMVFEEEIKLVKPQGAEHLIIDVLAVRS